MDPIEIRSIETEPLELRAAASGDGMTFSGWAVRYDQPSLPLPFVERVAQGAFTRTLKAKNDIRSYINHDDRLVLGSTRAKTMRLEDRAEGLWVETDLPDTSYGNDLRISIERGDVRTQSIGFSTVKDSWSEDGGQRVLHEVRLHEVSVVTGVAAYPQSTASVRSWLVPAKRAMVDVDALSQAIDVLQSGANLTPEQVALLMGVISALEESTPEPECIEVEASLSIPLSLLRKRLELIERGLVA
jgi:HK97 family phage prohead protease